jgi:hypothetical protein
VPSTDVERDALRPKTLEQGEKGGEGIVGCNTLYALKPWNNGVQTVGNFGFSAFRTISALTAAPDDSSVG